MKDAVDWINTLKDIIAAIWTWIFSWWVWWALAHLYQYTKTKEFEIIVFIISILIWAFSWYVVSTFTDNWAYSWVAWALWMKIFDFIQTKWIEILSQTVESKLNIKLKK